MLKYKISFIFLCAFSLALFCGYFFGEKGKVSDVFILSAIDEASLNVTIHFGIVKFVDENKLEIVKDILNIKTLGSVAVIEDLLSERRNYLSDDLINEMCVGIQNIVYLIKKDGVEYLAVEDELSMKINNLHRLCV